MAIDATVLPEVGGPKSAGMRSLAPIASMAVLLAARPLAAATMLAVPDQYATIQAAINAAAPGDTILVAAGTYQEKLWIKAHQTGLTIEAGDPANPPTILGTKNASIDGVRVDRVDGVTLRNLRIVGAYNGVRLNQVRGALLEHLHIENSALGVRFNRGAHNTLRDSVVAITRVEQGVLVDHSPAADVEDVAISNGYAGGLKVSAAPGSVLRNVTADDSHNHGVYVTGSRTTTVEGCIAKTNAGDGFRVINSKDLTFAGNASSANRGAGIRLSKSTPFASVADVTSAGNTSTDDVASPPIVVVP